MATEKILNTRVVLKHDTLANWNLHGDFVPKAGEVCVVSVPQGSTAMQTTPPATLFKVGDGTTTFANLPYASALSADVYAWAKAASRPAYKYGDSDLTGFGTAAAKNVDFFDAAGAASTAEANAKAYTDAEIQKLDSSAAADTGKVLTGITMTDGKITSFTQVAASVNTNTKYQIVISGTTMKLQSKELDGTWGDIEGQSWDLATVLANTFDAKGAAATAETNANSYTDTKVGAEKTRAEGVEGGLDTRLTAAETAIGSDGTTKTGLYKKIADEVTRATAAEGALSTAISAEETRATGVESGLNTRLTTAEGNITTLSNGKVDKVTGKSLVSDTEITKLAGVSEGANKVEATAKSGKISIDGTEVQIVADNTVTDANYKHITVTSTSVSDGTTTFNKYDDTALAARVTTAEGDIAAIEADYLKAADKTELSTAISNETTRATTAEGGLDTRIKALESKGRYLSTWDATTGLPDTYPQDSQFVDNKYNYRAGDYYIVNKVGASNNKMPDGAYITKSGTTYTVPSKAFSGTLNLGDQFQYDGSTWTHIASATTVAFKNIQGDAMENDNLAAKLNAKAAITYVDSQDALKVDKTQTIAGVDLQDNITKAEMLTALNVADGAQVNVIETIKCGGTALTIVDKAVDLETVAGGALATLDEVDEAHLASALATKINNKVDKVANKSLVADSEITRLAGMETGAQVNVIESVAGTDNYVTATKSGKTVTVDLAADVKTSLGKADSSVQSLEFKIADASGEGFKGASIEIYKNSETQAEGSFEIYNDDGGLDISKGGYSTVLANLSTTTKASLALADSALQKANIATGSTNGTIAVKGTDVAVKGLKSAAYTESSAYATAAQGTKADSALQAADITSGTSNGTIKVKGSEVSVAGLKSAAYTEASAYATAAQGAKADAALPAAQEHIETVSTTANGGLKVTSTTSGYTTNYKVDFDSDIVFVLDGGTSTSNV